ncbi:MAG: hypothetical protein ACTSSJ_05035 [Candidatus Odinarchaeia archaeon]
MCEIKLDPSLGVIGNINRILNLNIEKVVKIPEDLIKTSHVIYKPEKGKKLAQHSVDINKIQELAYTLFGGKANLKVRVVDVEGSTIVKLLGPLSFRQALERYAKNSEITPPDHVKIKWGLGVHIIGEYVTIIFSDFSNHKFKFIYRAVFPKKYPTTEEMNKTLSKVKDSFLVFKKLKDIIPKQFTEGKLVQINVGEMVLFARKRVNA